MSRVKPARLIDVRNQVDGPADQEEKDNSDRASPKQKEKSTLNQNAASPAEDKEPPSTNEKEMPATAEAEAPPEGDILFRAFNEGVRVAKRDGCWARHFSQATIVVLQSQAAKEVFGTPLEWGSPMMGTPMS